MLDTIVNIEAYDPVTIQGEKSMKIKPIVIAMPAMFALLTGCYSTNTTTNTGFPFFNPMHHHHHHHASTAGDIIENCIKVNEAEIKMANLAKAKSSCPMVKRFAATMANDHRQNLNEVRRVSRDIGVAPTMNADAARIEEKSAHKYAKLSMLHGHTFDREFIESMIHCHHKTLKMLDQAIQDSTYPKLTAYLQNTRQAVSRHLQEAEALQNKCTR